MRLQRVGDSNTLWVTCSAIYWYYRKEPISIHLAGERQRAEELVVLRNELMQWKRRVVVDDDRVHVHRCLPQTEATQSGAGASNEIELLKASQHAYLQKQQHYKVRN